MTTTETNFSTLPSSFDSELILICIFAVIFFLMVLAFTVWFIRWQIYSTYRIVVKNGQFL